MNKSNAVSLDSTLRKFSAELADFIGVNKDTFDAPPSIKKDPLLRIMALTYDIREEIYQAYEEIRPEGFPSTKED